MWARLCNPSCRVRRGARRSAVFVGQMNALAKHLKMERTRFVNPHGIDANVKPVPYSTALDMARLTRYAMDKRRLSFLRLAKGTANLVQSRGQAA